ncbi:MAG: hypothetical protein ACOYMA_12625 [Bacteroidia bacterium]
MFKFLVYLFLFYTATRFIFGTLLNFKKSNTLQDNTANAIEEEEIKVKPNKTSSNNSNKKNNSNIGEYVDFEEIK